MSEAGEPVAEVAGPVLAHHLVLTQMSSRAEVLRAFDQCRRSVSMALLGTPGIHVGYAELEFPELPRGRNERIEIEARVASASRNRHIVDYRAYIIGVGDLGPEIALIARARGLTITPR